MFCFRSFDEQSWMKWSFSGFPQSGVYLYMLVNSYLDRLIFTVIIVSIVPTVIGYSQYLLNAANEYFSMKSIYYCAIHLIFNAPQSNKIWCICSWSELWWVFGMEFRPWSYRWVTILLKVIWDTLQYLQGFKDSKNMITTTVLKIQNL